MCGIVAAVGSHNIIPLLIDGLNKLEYRGYDSTGIAYLTSEQTIECERSLERVAQLAAQINAKSITANLGIAHTRWATHGAPALRNAHPMTSNSHGVSIGLVHNGIIENFEEIKLELSAAGYVFTSDTDTEVMTHLIHQHCVAGLDLYDAVFQATQRLRGLYAIAVMRSDEPQRIIGARQGAPLLIGVGETGNYLASDTSALLSETRHVVYLEEGDVVEISLTGHRIRTKSGEFIKREVHESHLSADAVSLGLFSHYMQKETFEQPEVVANTLEMVSGAQSISPHLFGVGADVIFANTQNILILACGTSYHAAMVARYWLEELAQIPVNVEIASEYRYRTSVPLSNTLIITLSQSGETADTIAALQHAKNIHNGKHAATLSICNVPESALIRQSQLRFLTRAGPEIGVASTKAFTTQLSSLFVLTLVLAKVHGRLSVADETSYLAQLRHLPAAMAQVLSLEPQIIEWAKAFVDKQHALFLGRGIHWPIAMEGALKLKEITYIHAESYAAGELKHGPLALVDEHMPVVAIAPNDALIEKLKANLQEVRARAGHLYIFADQDTFIEPAEGMHVINLPDHAGVLSPILHTLPLQLLSYHTAVARGTDVDKPRNLAKSVTVE
ncbi:MAG: glutamine--fructose-6-phosphate transaminase (isomerizing) [Formosimonas sp.]